MNKILLFIGVFITFVLCLTNTTTARVVNVSTVSAFKTACTTGLLPGDTVLVADGTYDLNTYVAITVSGTASAPILIKAKNRGKAIIINKSFFNFKVVNYITVEGFVIESTDGTSFKIESCQYVRITRNIIRQKETVGQAWIIIQDIYNATVPVSEHNRIDHNLFENKSLAGNMIRLDGFQGTPTRASQYDLIDHNHFRNVGPRITNGMETIRLGVSSLSSTSGFTVVEYNLFEDCDGDPEYVSVKTDDDIVRFNTFRRSMGTCCLRQTSRSIVEGNFFFGDGKDSTGGVRVYRSDNKIFNNYFANLRGFTWDAALTMTNGDVDSNSTSQSSHFRSIRTHFVNNTLVNNFSNFEIGYTNNGNYTKPARDFVIANNIVVGTENPFFKYYTQPLSQTISGNIMYPTSTATLGITATSAQVLVADPQLAYTDSIWKLQPGSPAIDAATGTYNYVLMDVDGQTRVGTKDIGADEYTTDKVVHYPLLAGDVGPDAEEGVLTSVTQSQKSVLDYTLDQNYPNPFNPGTKISYTIAKRSNVSLRLVDMLGAEIMTLVSGEKEAGKYAVEFNAAAKGLSSGIYFYILKADNTAISKKMIYLK